MTYTQEPSGAGLGITAAELATQSLLRVKKEFFIAHAADVDYIVNEVDLTTLSVDDLLTLLTAADGRLLPNACQVTMTVVDASGTGASVTARITGRRMGRKCYEDITVTDSAGGGTTGTTDQFFDEVEEVKVTAISGEAASDTVAVGLSGNSLGLRQGRVQQVSDVLAVRWLDESGSYSENQVVPSTSNVREEDSGIYGLTLAAGDIYEVLYYDPGHDDGFTPAGAMAATPSL